MVRAKYPQSARKRGVLGPVLLSLRVDKQGVPYEVKVLKGDPDVAAAFVEAVKQWRYEPLKCNGEPVEWESDLSVRFHPGD